MKAAAIARTRLILQLQSDRNQFLRVARVAGVASFQGGSNSNRRRNQGYETSFDCQMSKSAQEQRREEFLERAQEAEQRAANASDSAIHQSWLKIAESYRDLARRQ